MEDTLFIPPLVREQQLRLFQQLHQSPDDETMDRYFWRRADKRTLCSHCGLPYIYHPHFLESWGWDGESIDYRLCSGEVVHL